MYRFVLMTPAPQFFLHCAFFALVSASAAATPDPFKTTIQPFLDDHCMNCHEEGTARAGFRLDTLSTDFEEGNNAGLWKEVMDQINSGQMPPKKKARPDPKLAFEVASWVAAQLEEATKLAQGAGGRVPLRRMNRVEYANTVRDLFALDENYTRRVEKELPADGKVGGFDRGATGLFMDEGQLTQYIAVADLVLGEAVFGEKPKMVKLEWDSAKGKNIHGIGVSWRNEKGEVIDDNPTPEFISTIKDPLHGIALEDTDRRKEKNYVPHGPMNFSVKNGGVEYLSGGSNHRPVGNRRSVIHGWDWAGKGVTQDGWYRLRVQAGAFAGAGAEAQKEVKLVMEYCYGSPIEVVKGVVIDAPLDAPKTYEFLVYLQKGPPGMSRGWDLGWDNGNKNVTEVNPEFNKINSLPVVIAGELERANQEGKPPEVIAEIKKRSAEALLAAANNRKNFKGPHYVWDPKLDIAKRPRLWLGKMEWEGPLVEWPPKGRAGLFFDGETRNDDAYLREIIARFLPRAYRRPATPEEVERVMSWTLKAKAERNLDFVAAVREGIENVLCSPAFLYLGGESPQTTDTKPASGPQPIDSWQLASRLSYLLWSSTPDDTLYALADKDALRDPAVLRAQVQRMITDPKSNEFVRSFAGQWLGVRNFDNGTPPNRDFYRHYDDPLRDSSKREPLEFFREVLRSNLPLTSFINSDFLVVNERLAKHYDLQGVEGEDFRRVAAPADGKRGGVLGMAGIMTYLADGTRTLPVRRATWVLDTLWNKPVPPPPPNAGDLPAIKDKGLSVRARLEQHAMSDNCASCHLRVDPFGLALENYDATGLWRERQNGEGMRGKDSDPALDVSGKLPNGREFKTVQEFKAALLAEKDAFTRGFTEKLLCYALGRPVGYPDHLAVEQIVAHAAKYNFALQEIIQATVASPFFQTK